MFYGDLSPYVRIQEITASLERGGWEARMIAMRDTDILALNQNVVIYLYGMYGSGTEEDAVVAFNGHVIPQRFTFDRVGSEAEFLAQTTDGYLRRGWLQGIGFRDTGADARDHYHQFDSVTGGGERMTLGRIVRHILGYYDTLGTPPATNPDWVAHTNLVYHATQNPHGWITLDNVTMTPFDAATNPDGSMRTDLYIVRESTNLWETLQQIAKNEFFTIYFTKENELYYCRHPMFSTIPPSPVMTFDEDFIVGRPVVEQHLMDTIRQVKLHALTDDGDPLHAEYPSSPTHVYGNVYEQSYIRCNSQDTLDYWAEVLYGYLNRPYTLRVRAAGLCGLLFEILDPVLVTYTGTTENGVHLSLTDETFWIHQISVKPDAQFGGITEFVLEADYGMGP